MDRRIDRSNNGNRVKEEDSKLEMREMNGRRKREGAVKIG